MNDEEDFEPIFTVDMEALGLVDAAVATEASSSPSERRLRKPRHKKELESPEMSMDKGHRKNSGLSRQGTRRRAPVKMRYS